MLPFLGIGPLQLPTYGLLLCTAILLGVRLSVARADRHGLPRNAVYTIASLVVLVALLGAKFTDWLIHAENGAARLVSSGGTFLGGFLLAFLATVISARLVKIPVWPLADSFAPSLALGVSIVRLGCFGASCDYGKPTALPWAVVFRSPAAAQLSGVPLGVPLHPTQIYESVLGLLILGVLLALELKPRLPGLMILVFVSLYSAGRFLLEFLRGDPDRGFWGPFSTSQWLALLTSVCFLVSICIQRAQQRG